ncbi:hypothetical protein B0H10DRAFT_1814445, partial [Mycena sp. CBHHK59/15]
LIGSLLNYCLYGVLAVQVYVYRLSFPNDKAAIKWLVYLVFSLETVMTALNGYDLYYWFAAGFGNLIRLSEPRVSPFYTPIMGSVMALVVQVFFCYRIYIIRNTSLYLCIFIALVSQTLRMCTTTIEPFSFMYVQFIALCQVLTSCSQMWLIGDAIADILISVVMSYFLLKASHNQHRQTNDIVKRIVRLTIETNSLSTVVAILSLILFYGIPNTTYFIAPTMVLAKLYANTLLVTFNNRAFIRAGGTTAHGRSASASDSYAPRSRAKTLPFSAGLGLNSDDTDTFDGSTYGGRVTVSARTITDDTEGRGSWALDRLQVHHVSPCAHASSD